MMNIFTTAVLFACLCFVESGTDNNKSTKTIRGISQTEVCKIKRSCLDCLRLVHCSWCETEGKCFSNELEPEKCKNDTTEYTDYGFSLQDNAQCSCSQEPAPKCFPEGTDENTAQPCSGRGRCVCGRCVCETYEHSTKMVMGDYCEFDNFSCDGPECNEGPYSLTQLKQREEPIIESLV